MTAPDDAGAAPPILVTEELVRIRAAIARGEVELPAVRALWAAVSAGLDVHPRSLHPAAEDPDPHGEHYCTTCTVTVGDQTVYVLWPCQTWRAIARRLCSEEDPS